MSTRDESFEKLAMPHLDAVYRAAVAICGRQSIAEDLVQDTFAKALNRFELFEKGTNCKAWLLQILRNTWIDSLRHQKVTGLTLPLEDEITAEATEAHETVWSNAEDLLENFSDEQIIKALSGLPEDQRLTLFLTDVENLSQKDVAQITGVAVGTVKSRVSRGRAELKNKLNSYAKQMGLIGGEK
ncbi:MAG: sigma-70 family RNA polymerase sigma factor [Planctomycetes bacterium]|nr:sigma-70 family RNA polymerase sigma factor [Planctomycetota bacterium]